MIGITFKINSDKRFALLEEKKKKLRKKLYIKLLNKYKL